MTTAEAPVDGRHRRREANREAVVEALLAFYREGRFAPSTDEVAERAGISARSLFRYFDDVDAMTRTAIARQQEHLAPLFDHGARADQPVHERIEAFVAGRLRLLAEMGEVGRLARARSIEQPLLAVEITRIRTELRQQVADLFEAELGCGDRTDRAITVAAIDVAVSWEAHDLLTNDQELPPAAVARVMATSAARLLQVEAS